MGGKAAGLLPGDIVVSLAGHDRGRIYAVLQNDGRFLLLCDGRLRGLMKPKRKNLSHVAYGGGSIDLSKVSCDAHVRKAIKQFKLSEGGCHLG